MTRARLTATIALLAAVFATPPNLEAQGAVAPADYPEARELARLVFDSGLYDVVLQTALKAGFAPVRATVETRLRRTLSVDEADALQAIFANAFRTVIPSVVLEELSARTFAANVSQQDAQEILRFYRSPAGAKALSLNALLARENAAASEELGRTRAPEFVRLFAAEMARRMPALIRELEAAK